MDLPQIIKGCVKQNRHAQEELYHKYKKILFVLCLKYCRNETEAEDNLHNAFVEIFTNIKKFDGKGSFEGWIKRITINKAIDSYKNKYQLVPIKDDLSEGVYLEESTEIDLSLDSLLTLIQELPNQYRLVFCLYELDNYSHKEISILLSISESTSKSNLHRAKVILKEKIKQKKSFNDIISQNGK
ncbi:RNA polymerase sigma factor [Flavobacterium sp. H122]|uniref:RNA polymerase sigma factor n=1 Tax=Flavobacterium sp. H122 TaxID=2529860 RepID=UPI0010A9E397|nr:sigma-70 family RNA polymerase sigma factor [Flavobacterium sp. H122]